MPGECSDTFWMRSAKPACGETAPLMKRQFLLDGTAWIDSQDLGFMRIVGQPAASVSFWVGRPTITMDFAKVREYWLLARNRSQAHGRLVGSSELTIEYSGYVTPSAVNVALQR